MWRNYPLIAPMPARTRVYAAINVGGLARMIAIGTVAGQSLRVARTNPIHALRYE